MSPLEIKMNALAEAADKMDYSGCSDSGVVMGYRKGFKAALELPEVKALVEALENIKSICSDPVPDWKSTDESYAFAIEALKHWDDLKSESEES